MKNWHEDYFVGCHWWCSWKDGRGEFGDEERQPHHQSLKSIFQNSLISSESDSHCWCLSLPSMMQWPTSPSAADWWYSWGGKLHSCLPTAEPHFYYVKAFLELSRVERGVHGNAMDGILELTWQMLEQSSSWRMQGWEMGRRSASLWYSLGEPSKRDFWKKLRFCPDWLVFWGGAKKVCEQASRKLDKKHSVQGYKYDQPDQRRLHSRGLDYGTHIHVKCLKTAEDDFVFMDYITNENGQ